MTHLTPELQYAQKLLSCYIRKGFDDSESVTEALGFLTEAKKAGLTTLLDEMIADLKSDGTDLWILESWEKANNEPADYSEVPGLEFLVTTHELVTLPEKI